MLRGRGSVFPSACKWAIPNAVLASVCHYFLHERAQSFRMEGLHYFWSGYTVTLSFLIVFRNNLAYNRYWEGAMSMAAIRGEWLNAMSSALAFSNPDHKDVRKFQCLIGKLASLLYASALQKVCHLEDDVLEVLNTDGLSPKCLRHLFQCETKSEVLTMWIERVMLQADRDKVIIVAPPILSRMFQDLGNGIVQLERIRTITEIPFPFPYAQMVAVMLVVHWLVTPSLAVVHLDSSIWAGVICFLLTGAMWSLIYIAQEIDQPFGDDANDLPIREMMADFNRALFDMLHLDSITIPEYAHEGDIMDAEIGTWSNKSQDRCSFARPGSSESTQKLTSAPSVNKMSSVPATSSSAAGGSSSVVVQPSDVECKVLDGAEVAQQSAKQPERSGMQIDGIFRESAAAIVPGQSSPSSNEGSPQGGTPQVTLRPPELLDLATSSERDIENPQSPSESHAASQNRLQHLQVPAADRLEGRQGLSGLAAGLAAQRDVTPGPISEQALSRSSSCRSTQSQSVFEASEVRDAEEPGRRSNPVVSSNTKSLRRRDD